MQRQRQQQQQQLYGSRFGQSGYGQGGYGQQGYAPQSGYGGGYYPPQQQGYYAQQAPAQRRTGGLGGGGLALPLIGGLAGVRPDCLFCYFDFHVDIILRDCSWEKLSTVAMVEALMAEMAAGSMEEGVTLVEEEATLVEATSNP